MRAIDALAFAACLLSGAVHANGDALDEHLCPDAAVQPAEMGHAQVVGQGRLPLHEEPGCVSDHGKRCPGAGYLVPGDRLLTGRRQGSEQCVFYPNRQGGSLGWVPVERLRAQTAPAPGLPAWAGRWTYGDNVLRIALERGTLKVEGDAYWPAADPPADEFPGGPNLGGVEGPAVVHGDTLEVRNDGCVVRASLLGDYLLVSDNHECGGMNVRFNGLYRRGR